MRTVNLTGAKPILYGEAPYGWKLTPDRSNLTKDAEEQRVLSVVRHLYLADRLAMREIVARLAKMGIKNRRGRSFGLSGVWEMIHKRNEAPPESRRVARAAKTKAPKKLKKAS